MDVRPSESEAIGPETVITSVMIASLHVDFPCHLFPSFSLKTLFQAGLEDANQFLHISFGVGRRNKSDM